MSAGEPRYAVVVPVYNSAGLLRMLHERIVSALERLEGSYELLLVDDGSEDDSWSVMRELAEQDPRVVAIQLMRNSGQGSATLCGINYARAEVIVTMDDDLQHPPEEIPALVDALSSDPNLDVVIGIPRVRRHGIVRRIGSRLIDRMNTMMLRKPPGLQFSGFRAMNANVAAQLASNRFHRPALGPMLISVTNRIENLEIEHAPRAAGRSGYTPLRLIQQAMSNAIGYSMLPLRFLAGLGMFGIVASLVLAGYYLLRYITGGVSVPGFTTQALLVTGLFGFNFFAFGVIGEYVLRILQLTGAQAGYSVRDVAGARAAEVRRSQNQGRLCDSST